MIKTQRCCLWTSLFLLESKLRQDDRVVAHSLMRGWVVLSQSQSPPTMRQVQKQKWQRSQRRVRCQSQLHKLKKYFHTLEFDVFRSHF